jgi:uncharacterized protein (DUF2235 family)
MKRIVIACDGTWNRLDSAHPTNVAKFAQAVLPAGPDGVAQLVCHLDGVGSGRGTGWLAQAADRALGGLFGGGLMATLAEAYRFLVLNYAPGDQIHLVGFSRGAYTARSLAGLIRNCAIPDRAHAAAIPAALALYRARSPATGPDGAAACWFRALHAAHVTTGPGEAAWRAERALPEGVPLRIAFVGVWDTVGALGLPGRLRLAPLVNRRLAFHDTALSGNVAAARHAVAIDERRRTFPPTLWDNLAALNAGADPAPYVQRWFPGDHGSVGGGSPVSLLSNDALLWVADGAASAGLALDAETVGDWRRDRDFLGPLTARPAGIRALLALDSRERRGPDRAEDVADAAVRRWRSDPGYRPRALRRVRRWLEDAAGERGRRAA